MKLLRIGAAVALLTIIGSSAMAQEMAPTTPSNFINILLGAMAGLLTTVVLPLAYLWGQQLMAEHKLKLAQLEEQMRATLDSGAQKAIGGALGDVAIPDGKITGPAKAEVVKVAAAALAKNYPETFAALGVENVPAKAAEMVRSRMGMMDAEASGRPVPNPSAPISAPTTQTVNVAKK